MGLARQLRSDSKISLEGMPQGEVCGNKQSFRAFLDWWVSAPPGGSAVSPRRTHLFSLIWYQSLPIHWAWEHLPIFCKTYGSPLNTLYLVRIEGGKHNFSKVLLRLMCRVGTKLRQGECNDQQGSLTPLFFF